MARKPPFRKALAWQGLPLLLLSATMLLPHGGSMAQSSGPSSRRDDVVQARQLLMDAVEEQVGPVDAATTGPGTGKLEDLKSRAYMINTLLAAFPHLFPSLSKPAEIPADGQQTNAKPAVWDEYDTFYALSQAAATAAYDASQSSDQASFRTHAAELRKACDSCHAEFMVPPAGPSAPK